MLTKKELLTQPIQHIDIKQHNVVALVDAMQSMAFSSRDTARAPSATLTMMENKAANTMVATRAAPV